MVENLLSFAFATVVLALSPGPDNLYVLTQSLANGTKSGLATTAGLISGCLVHTTLLAFGLSSLLMASPLFFTMIKAGGAGYLIFLAYKTYRAPSEIQVQASAPAKSYGQLYRIGVTMNLLNPKVMLFFLAFFPGFLWDPEGQTVLQFYVLGFIFMLVSLGVFSGVALLAGRISGWLRHQHRVGFYLKWLQILVFVGIALFILLA